MKTWMIVFIGYPLIGTSQENLTMNKQNHTENEIAITVTKEYDEKGRLIQYDSIYTTPRETLRIQFGKTDSIPSPMYLLPPNYGSLIDDFDFLNSDTIDYISQFRSIWNKMDTWPSDIQSQQKLDSVFGKLPFKILEKMPEFEMDLFQNESFLDSLMIRINEFNLPSKLTMKSFPKYSDKQSFSFFDTPRKKQMDSLMFQQLQKMEDNLKRLEEIFQEYEPPLEKEIL